MSSHLSSVTLIDIRTAFTGFPFTFYCPWYWKVLMLIESCDNWINIYLKLWKLFRAFYRKQKIEKLSPWNTNCFRYVLKCIQTVHYKPTWNAQTALLFELDGWGISNRKSFVLKKCFFLKHVSILLSDEFLRLRFLGSFINYVAC